MFSTENEKFSTVKKQKYMIKLLHFVIKYAIIIDNHEKEFWNFEKSSN